MRMDENRSKRSRGFYHRRRRGLRLFASAVALAGCGTGGGASAGAGMMGGSADTNSRPSCSVPPSLPGRTVQVTLVDMGMNRMMGGTAPQGARMALRATPMTVAAGPVSLVGSNRGWRTHELVILPLAEGASAGQRVVGTDGKVAEDGSLGEASKSCAKGTGDGIESSAVGWITLTLPHGRYELICNLTNHYADGMHQELTVT